MGTEWTLSAKGAVASPPPPSCTGPLPAHPPPRCLSSGPQAQGVSDSRAHHASREASLHSRACQEQHICEQQSEAATEAFRQQQLELYELTERNATNTRKCNYKRRDRFKRAMLEKGQSVGSPSKGAAGVISALKPPTDAPQDVPRISYLTHNFRCLRGVLQLGNSIQVCSPRFGGRVACDLCPVCARSRGTGGARSARTRTSSRPGRPPGSRRCMSCSGLAPTIRTSKWSVRRADHFEERLLNVCWDFPDPLPDPRPLFSAPALARANPLRVKRFPATRARGSPPPLS